MLFNSFEFIIFLPLVFALFWALPAHKERWRNSLLVIASYVFYGWWDERFLLLILFSTVLDYSIGRKMGQTERVRYRKYLLYASLFGNLGLLGFFKYYNFFVENFVHAFSWFGLEPDIQLLSVVLPVGISFYTFQTLSYTIDVYRKKLKPTNDFLAFAAYVSFFPQLVAGPIERATHLLPQFLSRRKFDYLMAVDGLRQILWGFFKKLVIADNCAVYANMIFNDSESYSGSTLLLGAFFFAFQIYGDFSGYSDIAIGTARLFGFDLRRNFAFPYFSRNIAEFWRRWHISLSTWFRDYLYIPLGGNRVGKWKLIRNVFVVFIVSGFWHGANWTFVVWGGIHALFYLPVMLSGKHRKHLDIVASNKLFPKFKEVLQMLSTFAIVVLAWVFFRAESLGHALQYLKAIFSSSLFTIPDFDQRFYAVQILCLLSFFLMIEWQGRHWAFAIEYTGRHWSRPLRWAWYTLLVFIIGMFMQTMETPFIYFQF